MGRPDPRLPPDLDLRRFLALLPPTLRDQALRQLAATDLLSLDRDWPTWAHAGQCAPPGEWRTWVLMAGRGFGKTLAGSQWVRGLIEGERRPPTSLVPSEACPEPVEAVEGRLTGAAGRTPLDYSPGRGPELPLGTSGLAAREPLRIALVGATIDEARRIMVEGKSGLLSVAGDLVAEWHPSRRLLRFRNGAEATLFSGASPEALRGPEHHLAWCDELAKWPQASECWDMLQLGLRLGTHPRALVTTTPRAGPVLGRIMAEPGCVTTGGATRANPHLPPAFVETMERLYGGTRLGEQELEGRLITDAAGALWTVEVLEGCRAAGHCSARPEREGVVDASSARPERSRGALNESAGQPAARSDHRTDVTNSLRDGLFPPHSTLSRSGRGRWSRIVIGVDPPAGDGTCGIVACALDEEGIGHVLADHSVTARSPEGWARAVAEAARQWGEEAARPERRMVRPVEGRWPERAPYGYGAIPEPPAELTFAAPVLIVAEQNQGGAMVRSVLHAADPTLAVKLVSASTAKSARAEPVAMLFEQGRVRLHGRFPELEAQLTGMIAGGGYEGPGKSPDRADAMVWALTELMVGRRGEPRVRSL